MPPNAPYIIAAVIAFGVMIMVHELGHFLVAKRVGITVHAFALGFGPKLIGVQRGETHYSINIIPFGGYVRMAGEDLDNAAGPGSFRTKSVWQRMAVVVAGPAMNLALSLVLLMTIALTVGVGATNRIGYLVPGWPAEQAGLQRGDTIVAINGRPMQSGDDVIETIHARPDQDLVLTVERSGRRLEVPVRSRRDQTRNIGLIGFKPEPIRVGVGRALAWSIRTEVETVKVIFTALGGLLREGREMVKQLAGPIGAVRFLGEAGAAGAEIFIYTAAVLSIMIGVFNLLPIPALDGGRLLFLAVEALRRRPVDARREAYIHLVGFALLMLLLIRLTVFDLFRR
jgi:regulator of sigma E protease